MTDLFISDIHIGSKRFHNPEGLSAILNNGYNKRYILGDIIDTYDQKWETIVKNNQEIISTINNLSCIIILGNHDPKLEIMNRIFPHCTIYEKYYSLYIHHKHTILMHGHKYHIWCHIYHSISGLFRRKSYTKELFQYLHERYSYNQFKHNILGIDEKRTIKHLYNTYDRIIMGHTHTPKIIKTPHMEYINTGSWIYKPSYIEYDHNSNNFNLTWV